MLWFSADFYFRYVVPVLNYIQMVLSNLGCNLFVLKYSELWVLRTCPCSMANNHKRDKERYPYTINIKYVATGILSRHETLRTSILH